MFKRLRRTGRHGDRPSGNHRPSTGSVVFGCVTDTRGRYVEQAARLLLSLRWFGGRMADQAFVLAVVGELGAGERRFFERHGARIVQVEPFDERHGPSNKLRFFEIQALDEFDHIVLLDCDTVIVQDPTEWVRARSFAAKPADLPTVTTESLSQYLAARGIRVPGLDFRHDVADMPCLPYFNSGVIVLGRPWRAAFVDAWQRFDRDLIECAQEFGIKLFHVDQASLTAALLAEGIPVEALPSAMNFPVHLDPARYPDALAVTDPVIIHYHGLVDGLGYIRTLPFPGADLRARAFNARLRAEIFPRRGCVAPLAKPAGPKVVVGTGWWSSDEASEWHIGADVTRSEAFFDLWYRQVMKCIGPDRILVTDSRAPRKPDWRLYPRVQWIELDRNYGSANDIRVGKMDARLCGFTRSVINGAMYAYCCDADFFVYIEQDCLVRGQDFLERAIGGSRGEIFLGQKTAGGRGLGNRPAAPMLQQSCMIVRNSGLERFMTGIMAAPESDGEVSPEAKMERDLQPFELIAVPYGRSRPVDFAREHYYVQHLTDEELRQFLEMEKLAFSETAGMGAWIDV